jgi:hypothetical protein
MTLDTDLLNHQLTELTVWSSRYTGKHRKYIPADVTFPVLALSSYTKKQTSKNGLNVMILNVFSQEY